LTSACLARLALLLVLVDFAADSLALLPPPPSTSSAFLSVAIVVVVALYLAHRPRSLEASIGRVKQLLFLDCFWAGPFATQTPPQKFLDISHKIVCF